MVGSTPRAHRPGRGDRGRDARGRWLEDQALRQDRAAGEGVRARLGRKTDRGALAEPTVRQQKLQRAASSRMSGLRIVLEDCEDVGNRAAHPAHRGGLRPAPHPRDTRRRAQGPEWPREEDRRRAQRAEVAADSVHRSAAEQGRAARGGLRVDFGGGAGRGRDPAERVVARGARAQPRRRRGRDADDAARKAAVDRAHRHGARARRFRPAHGALLWERAPRRERRALRRMRRRDDDPNVRAHREPQRVRRRRARHPLWPRGAREGVLGAERLNAAGGDMSAAEVEALLGRVHRRRPRPAPRERRRPGAARWSRGSVRLHIISLRRRRCSLGPSTPPVQAQYQPRTASHAQRGAAAIAADGLATELERLDAVDGHQAVAARPLALGQRVSQLLLARERRPAVAAQAVEHRRRARRRLRRGGARAPGAARHRRRRTAAALAAGSSTLASAANAMTAPVHTQHGGVSIVPWWRTLGCVERRSLPSTTAGRESARPDTSTDVVESSTRPRTRTCAATSASSAREDEAQHDDGRHRPFSEARARNSCT